MKTILITGSTDGIGKLAAMKLAKDGHQILLHGRNAEKLQNVISEVKTAANNENISGFVADFSDMKAVRNMAEDIKNTITKIDVLINNAGIFKSPVDTSQAGIDIRFAVNYFAPYILTNALLPLLKNSTQPRVINLSSAAQAAVSLEALAGKSVISSVNEAYAQSKLALTMWSFKFAQEHKNMTTIAVNPGSLLNTKMANEAYGQHWSSADKGMNILHDLSISGEYENESGKYFDNDKGDPKGCFAPAHPDAYHQAKIEALIIETEEIIRNF